MLDSFDLTVSMGSQSAGWIIAWDKALMLSIIDFMSSGDKVTLATVSATEPATFFLSDLYLGIERGRSSFIVFMFEI